MKKLAMSMVFILIVSVVLVDAQRIPALGQLKQVSQLPVDVAQRAAAIAFDGERFWVPLYLDRARLVSFDPKTETWDTTRNDLLASLSLRVSGRATSPGGITFANGRMWFANTYGDSLGWIDLENPEKFKKYQRIVRPDWEGTQSYTDLTFDGTSIWASWLATDYYGVDKLKTQLLLEIDPTNGEIISTSQIPFGGLSDLAHGLTWDGENLWYGFQNSLRAIDRKGKELAKYSLKGVGRISGIAWDGDALWIIEFDGKLWRLPLKDPSLKQPA